jgi:riboflavin kinase/FMN adenylyltransferase
MKLLRGFQQISALQQATAATIGNFDGVHLGHQALLKRLRSEADRRHLPILVMLFEPQPGEYFRPEQAPARLSSLREKLASLKTLGVDYVCCLRFDNDLASIPAQHFAEQIIFSLLKARYLLLGEDFRFGMDRAGDVDLLKALASNVHCEVQAFSDFYMDQQRVSSTQIRQALKAGDLGRAATLLGRPYSLCGRVIYGDGRGRQWGIPTANLNIHHRSLALHGVYCVQVMREGTGPVNGVANIGYRPTVDGRQKNLEVHLFDVDESLYGEILEVRFLHPLRGEIKFDSVDRLIAQIHTDIELAKHWFNGHR